MNVVTANLIIYQIGKRLFDGNRKKADLMLVFVCVLQLFCGTIYSSGTFFFTRSYEGKAILANIAIPSVLMCAVWYLQEKNSRNVWIILFVTAVSALTFSGSAIIFPIVIAAGMAPAAVMNKRFRGWYIVQCVCFHRHYMQLYFCMQNRSADAGCIIIQKGEKMAGVTIQELGLRFVDACMRLYWGSCWYPLLFAVGLICTLVLGRKRKSGIFVGYTVFLLLTVYNPLVVKYLIAKVKFENEYYRFIWILPVIPAVAYYGVRLVTAFRKTWIKVLMAAAVLTGFVILGNPLDGVVTNFAMAENIYKVPNDLRAVCDVIHQNQENDFPRVVLTAVLTALCDSMMRGSPL